MSLLDLRGGFLSDARPDLFPEGAGITETELSLWELYYADKNQRIK